MKRTKREENALIIVNVIYGALIIIILYFFISYIVPSIKDISLLKSSVSATYLDINRIKKEGVNYSEFNENINTIIQQTKVDKKEDNLYLSEILKSIDEKFYNENIKNSTEDDFNTFIDALSKKYSDNSTFDNKVDTISKILPVYSEEVSDLGENALNDFKFINYIESIAETFNVNFTNSIGISELKLLDDYSVGVGDNNLDTNIFYIPLTLDLNGTKSSILDFLYFVDNIGKIELDKDQNINIKNDINKDFLDFKNKVLKGQIKDEGYNIFNNQVFDIESVEFDNYLDSSFDLTDPKVSFISNIKNTQGRELIKANVSLRFYIKGIPIFKIENFIRDFIVDFTKMKSDVEGYIAKLGQDSTKSKKLTEINTVLDQIQINVINGIQKNLSTKVGLDEAFKQVNIYKNILDNYKKDLEQFKN
ncbi:MAG: hypothetical protein PHV23_03890 [Candidatus Gracilibacteria bacterium]|nr:hypothetical protein [Candidatus Gracilibacteria bacterium]